MRRGLAGVLAAALVAVGAFLVVSQVSAVSGTLSISSPTIAPGGQGTADLRSNVPAPGLGAWAVDITYDPTKVSVASCAPAQGGVCNPDFAANVVRIVGAAANGLVSDTSLGTITFNMLAATAADYGAASALTLAASVFVDATIADPQPITVTLGSGTVTCAAATERVSLVVTIIGAGSVTGTGINCSPIILFRVCIATLPKNTLVTLQAAPIQPWEFVGWIGDECEPQGALCRFPIEDDTIVTAVFRRRAQVPNPVPVPGPNPNPPGCPIPPRPPPVCLLAAQASITSISARST